MPAGGANSARPLFRASAACFLMRPCLRGALYNTHSAGHFNPAFPFRKSQKCGHLPSLTSFFQNRIPRYGKMPFRRSGNLRFGKSLLSNINPPRSSAPANPRQNRRKKNARTYAARPKKKTGQFPIWNFRSPRHLRILRRPPAPLCLRLPPPRHRAWCSSFGRICRSS